MSTFTISLGFSLVTPPRLEVTIKTVEFPVLLRQQMWGAKREEFPWV